MNNEPVTPLAFDGSTFLNTFNRTADRPRLVAILSPTWPHCLQRASDINEIMSNYPNCSGNWLTYKRHYDIKGNNIYIRTAETYAMYQKYAKSNRAQAEMISKHSFLQQLQSKEYFVSKGTVRIGGDPCQGIRLDLNAMPDYIDVNFAA